MTAVRLLVAAIVYAVLFVVGGGALFLYLLAQDPCLPNCSAADAGAYDDVMTVVLPVAFLAYLGSAVVAVLRRRSWGVLLVPVLAAVVAFGGAIAVGVAVDAATADVATCDCG